MDGAGTRALLPGACTGTPPGEQEGITREVMKSSLVSMSGVRRHARNLREVLDWRSWRTPGERRRARSARAQPQRDAGRDLPTPAASPVQSVKLHSPKAVEWDQDFVWKRSPKTSPVWSKLLSEITNEEARKSLEKGREEARRGRDKIWR